MLTIDCSELYTTMLNELNSKFAYVYKKSNVKLKVVVLLIGYDGSNDMIREAIMNAYNYVGVLVEVREFVDGFTEERCYEEIQELNSDTSVHGICLLDIVRNTKAIELIDPKKDIEGIHPLNLGRFYLGLSTVVPTTAKAVAAILRACRENLAEKNVVVIGRSYNVGKAIALNLLHENYTVTICHSRTKNLAYITSRADIIVSAIGKPKFLTWEYFSDLNRVIIDCGCSLIENDTQLYGDVDIESIKNKKKDIVSSMELALITILCSLNNLLSLTSN